MDLVHVLILNVGDRTTSLLCKPYDAISRPACYTAVCTRGFTMLPVDLHACVGSCMCAAPFVAARRLDATACAAPTAVTLVGMRASWSPPMFDIRYYPQRVAPPGRVSSGCHPDSLLPGRTHASVVHTLAQSAGAITNLPCVLLCSAMLSVTTVAHSACKVQHMRCACTALCVRVL